MSLKTFVELPQVREILAPILPPPTRCARQMCVPRRTLAPSLLGTAFDYLLRIELKRRFPHARTRRWVAELGPAAILTCPGLEFLEQDPRTIVAKASASLARAMEYAEAFARLRRPSTRRLIECAGHSLQLARLDLPYRCRFVDPDLGRVSKRDVDELVSLLRVVPFEELAHPRTVVLNPTFGEASARVGGADGDIIAGDTLVEIKVTSNASASAPIRRQAIGYLLLAREARRRSRSFPVVQSVAIYFARHATLHRLGLGASIDSRAFRRAETAFWTEADAVYSQ